MSSDYKFDATDFRCTQHTCQIDITNKGVAPTYYPALVNINGTRSSINLRRLKPGRITSVNIIDFTSPNKVAIKSDHLLLGQKIERSLI